MIELVITLCLLTGGRPDCAVHSEVVPTMEYCENKAETIKAVLLVRGAHRGAEVVHVCRSVGKAS